MERSAKLKLHLYFLCEVCVCGQWKKSERWACKHCVEENKDDQTSKLVDELCDKHLEAVDKYLRVCGCCFPNATHPLD